MESIIKNNTMKTLERADKRLSEIVQIAEGNAVTVDE